MLQKESWKTPRNTCYESYSEVKVIKIKREGHSEFEPIAYLQYSDLLSGGIKSNT